MEISIKDFQSKQGKLQCMELRAPQEEIWGGCREVIFVLDNSSFIPEVAQGEILEKYKEMYDEFFLGEDTRKLTPGLFVNYSRTVTGGLLLPGAHEENKAQFKLKEPTDRSAISQTLKSLADYMEKNTATRALTIIICIGGYENMESMNKLYNNLELLHQVAQTRLVDFHCLGFGDIHDVYLLSKLMRLATSKSTYQYVDSPESLGVAIDNIKNVMKSPQTCFFVHKDQEKYKIVPRWDPIMRSHLGRLYGVLPEGASYEFFQMKSIGEITPGGSLQKSSENISLEQRLDFLRANITSFINNLNNKMDGGIIAKSKEVLLELDGEVGNVIKEISELKDIKQRPVLFLAQKNRFLITRTIEALNLAREKKLSVAFIGALLSFASSLDTPELYDFSNLIEIDQEILRASSSLSLTKEEIAEITSKESWDLQRSSSNLCPETPLAMLTRGDCYCVGLRVEGKEPIDVYTKLISAESFFSLVNSGKDLTFKNSLGDAEVINWVFPIYINKGHWTIGRLKWKYLKELMELNADFPFKLLMIIINKQAMLGDDKNIREEFDVLYDLVLDTCVELWGEDGRRDFIEAYHGYIENYANRAKIASNCLFCTKALVAFKANHISAPTNEFLFCMYEEEMRREVINKLKPLPSFQVDNILLTSLGVICYWDRIMKEIDSPYVYVHYLIDKMMDDALESSHQNPIIKDIKSLTFKDYEGLLQRYLREDLKSKERKAWDTEACYFPIPSFLKHFAQKANQIGASLTFKIETHALWYRALLTHSILRRNAKESRAFTANDLEERAPCYLFEKAKEILEEKARKEISEIIYRQVDSFDAPGMFAKVDNLEGASAILYGKKMGAELRIFVDKLAEVAQEEINAKGACGTLLLEKFVLICTGKYYINPPDDFINLWDDFDTFTKGSPIDGAWLPSKKIVKKFGFDSIESFGAMLRTKIEAKY